MNHAENVKHTENILREGERAATYRPSLQTMDEGEARIADALKEASATIERLHRENSALRQDLETARQEVGRLRARLEKVENGEKDS